MTWKVGLIGVGRFIREGYLPALQSLDDLEVTLMCGRSRERLEAVRSEWSLDARVEVGEPGLRAALKDGCVDAVIVAVPDRFHAEMIVPALEAGCHVLCEKPMTADLASARIIRDLAAGASGVHMMSFTYRYTHAIRKVRELIDDGSLGLPMLISGEVHWGGGGAGWRGDRNVSPGGIWFDGGSHFVDVVGVLAGRLEVASLLACSAERLENQDTRNPDIAVISGTVERASSTAPIAVAGLLSRIDGAGSDQVRVVGTEGVAEFSLGRGEREWVDVWRPGKARERLLALQEDYSIERGGSPAVRRMVESWRDAMNRGSLGEWDAGLDIGYQVQEILAAGLTDADERATNT